MTDLLWTRPETAPRATLLLAHGAGAAMDSAFMTRLAEALAAEAIAVARFEFPYMAERRSTGRRRPPPKAETLVDAYRAAIEAVRAEAGSAAPLLIGGKSMGGRVAVMAAGPDVTDAVAGVVVFGYPFHPPADETNPRVAPLAAVGRPTLVLQGERDEFGDRAEVESYALGDAVTVTFVEDGSHDFGPRGSSPATLKGNIRFAAAETAAFAARLAGAPRAGAADSAARPADAAATTPPPAAPPPTEPCP
ncbi:alpha/beta family hydrolase [Prosthecomicrobium hirschii]|uniref:alpha/beta family hydrolase n=1 Tax=Prosthecodimorpha hirschii TaxID=665126 RepID=UPI0009F8F192|nr:alpha/beta family hydrolase [Prosthecomicrobium hirschii]